MVFCLRRRFQVDHMNRRGTESSGAPSAWLASIKRISHGNRTSEWGEVSTLTPPPLATNHSPPVDFCGEGTNVSQAQREGKQDVFFSGRCSSPSEQADGGTGVQVCGAARVALRSSGGQLYVLFVPVQHSAVAAFAEAHGLLLSDMPRVLSGRWTCRVEHIYSDQ
jgi:hypothetical protein